MDWNKCRATVMGACTAINEAARETQNIKPIKAAVRARTELAQLLRELAAIDDTNQLEQLLAVALLIALYEQQSAQGQPDYFRSATAAVEQLADGREVLRWLRDPAIYMKYVASIHTAAAYRDKGLPIDRLRQALRSHLKRLANASAARASSADLVEFYAALRQLLLQIEHLYIQLQTQAIGQTPPDRWRP